MTEEEQNMVSSAMDMVNSPSAENKLLGLEIAQSIGLDVFFTELLGSFDFNQMVSVGYNLINIIGIKCYYKNTSKGALITAVSVHIDNNGPVVYGEQQNRSYNDRFKTKDRILIGELNIDNVIESYIKVIKYLIKIGR